ncbi:MAG: RNA polymerase sigma factor [Solirubrobacterales bacterium]|jgi:hypothetical protein|nr:RNA polymerase sigma factor [Solirubrobacterales bacterium]
MLPFSDDQLLAALKRGDEAAFSALVERHQPLMLRVARRYVRDRAVAEEVVQETWLGMLNGLDRFEGRASLKTWIFRILTNHNGYDGVFLALPGTDAHLELTAGGEHSAPSPHLESLRVLYLGDDATTRRCRRLRRASVSIRSVPPTRTGPSTE